MINTSPTATTTVEMITIIFFILSDSPENKEVNACILSSNATKTGASTHNGGAKFNGSVFRLVKRLLYRIGIGIQFPESCLRCPCGIPHLLQNPVKRFRTVPQENQPVLRTPP